MPCSKWSVRVSRSRCLCALRDVSDAVAGSLQMTWWESDIFFVDIAQLLTIEPDEIHRCFTGTEQVPQCDALPFHD